MENQTKASAEQFVLVNKVFTHDQTSLGHVFAFVGKDNLPKGVPTNWKSPVNYCQGKIHIRVEVLSKPTKAKVKYMLYLLSGGHGDEYRAVIGHNLVEFTEPGVYEFEEDVSSIFDYKNVNWEQPIDEMLVSVWDKNNFPIDTRWGHGGKWDGSPDTSLYYPMKVHYTVVVVPEGGKFQGWPGKLELVKADAIALLQRSLDPLRAVKKKLIKK